MLKLIFAVLAMALPTHAAIVLTSGDVEFSVNFRNSFVGTATNPWLVTMRDGPSLQEYAGTRAGHLDPEHVILSAGEEVKFEVPDDPRYTFLGASGAAVWILPEGSDTEQLTPGISTENRTAQTGWQGVGVPSEFLVQGVPNARFTNNRVSLRLASFSGPGDFFLYRLNGFGDPLIAMRTDDGLSGSDASNFTAGSHTHFNWAFTAPGDYYLGLQATGTLAGGQSSSSEITTFHFLIVPEPSTIFATICGVVCLGWMRVRRHPSSIP